MNIFLLIAAGSVKISTGSSAGGSGATNKDSNGTRDDIAATTNTKGDAMDTSNTRVEKDERGLFGRSEVRLGSSRQAAVQLG